MSIIKCNHCQLEFDQSIMINEKPDLYFCCNGCKGVYHLLKEDGLDSFYSKMKNKTIAPPLESSDNVSDFDLDSFRQRYIQITDDGFSKIDLVIEGIHCAACVWLNEQVIDDLEGVLEVNINFSNNKAKITWDEETTKLSEIIEKIRSVGYNAYPYISDDNDIKATKTKRDFFMRMSVGIFGSMNIMMIDIAKYAGMFMGMKAEFLYLVHIVELIFSSLVLFYSGWIFFRGAYFGLKNKIVNMDLLVSIGALVTYIYSILVLFGLKGHTYFDSVAMIITFVLVGKFLEVKGKKTAIDSMDKMKSNLQLEATIIVNNEKCLVSLDKIKVGDIIELKHGEKASVDGLSLFDLSTFDERSLTGESIPIEKQKNDIIYSGTINTGQVVRYKATKNYAQSTFNIMINLLEDSLASKPKIEETTNEVSKYFSLTIIILAIITFLIWYFSVGNFEQSLIVMISVIVIACPCALALATPIASLIGISWASQKGLLFKEAKFIESFAKADTVVFDKTGTLTKGILSIKHQSKELQGQELALLYALLDSSTHPISKTIKKYLPIQKSIFLDNIKQVSSQGMMAWYDGKQLLGGNSQFLKDNGVNVYFDSDYTVYHFAYDGVLLTSFELEDQIKDDAKELVKYLKSIGIKTIMATGDHKKVAKRIAKEININTFYSSMSAIEKATLITNLKQKNKTVVMIGDGINDTLALSKADVAISMGSGADIALSVSDVVILNNSLKGVKNSFYISKRTFLFIKQNLLLSLIYNAITIPIAMAGYVDPLVAALSMSLSSLIVVGNSMRIRNENV